jgi:hypothetical protein
MKAYTASVNAFTASQQATNTTQATLNANLNGFTASFSASLTSIGDARYVLTSSYGPFTASLNSFSQSVNTFTASQQTTNATQAALNLNLNGFTASFSASAQSIGDARYVQKLNGFTGSLQLLAGPNITINSGSGFIMITGSAAGGTTDVTGSDNFFVKQTLQVSGNIWNPVSHLILSSGLGIVTVSGTLRATGDIQNTVSKINGYSGSITFVAGDNVLITSGSNTITIYASLSGSGSGGIATQVTGADNFTVKETLQVSGTVTNPVGFLILSSGLGSTVTVSGNLQVIGNISSANLDARYVLTSSYGPFTASLNSFSQSVNTFTASQITTNAAQATLNTNLNLFSASINIFSQSVNTFTASLNLFTQSLPTLQTGEIILSVATGGTDANASRPKLKSGSYLAYPFRSFQGAIDQLASDVNRTLNYNVYITSSVGTFDGFNVEGFTGKGELTVAGAFVISTVTSGTTGGTAGAGSTSTSANKPGAAANWPSGSFNELRGKAIIVDSGGGVSTTPYIPTVRFIESNTTSSIAFGEIFGFDATSVFRIVDVGTIITSASTDAIANVPVCVASIGNKNRTKYTGLKFSSPSAFYGFLGYKSEDVYLQGCDFASNLYMGASNIDVGYVSVDNSWTHSASFIEAQHCDRVEFVYILQNSGSIDVANCRYASITTNAQGNAANSVRIRNVNNAVLNGYIFSASATPVVLENVNLTVGTLAGHNPGTATAVTFNNGGQYDVTGATISAATNDFTVEGISDSWTNLSSHKSYTVHGVSLHWGTATKNQRLLASGSLILTSSISDIAVSGNLKVIGSITNPTGELMISSSLSRVIFSSSIVMPHGGGAFFSGNGIGIGIDIPTESIHVVNGNVRIEGSGTDLSYIVKNYGLPLYPQFRMGSIIHGGDGDPEIRWIYSDLSSSERSVFEFDKKGIVASIKPPGFYGSHFEGFMSGDPEPMFRLNGYPSMSLELGSGSDQWTDVIFRRKKAGHAHILSQLSGGAPVTGNLDVANIYSSEGHLHLSSTFGYVTVSGNLKVLGSISGSNNTTLNTFSGAVTLAPGANITIDSVGNVITINGASGGSGSVDVSALNSFSASINLLTQSLNGFTASFSASVLSLGDARYVREVTGSDNFFVKQTLQVSGTIINPVGELKLSSSAGRTIHTGSLILPVGGGTSGGGYGIAIGANLAWEALHIFAGNARIEGPNEYSYIVKRTDMTNGPQFQFGRLAGDGDPKVRFMYEDDLTAERSVFDVSKSGTVASYKPLSTYGSHFEGYITGETQPLFRLNSFPSMSLEFGSGATTTTDVILRRKKAGHLEVISQLSNGTRVTGNLDVANIYNTDGHLHLSSSNGSTVAVSGNLKVIGDISNSYLTDLGGFTSSFSASVISIGDTRFVLTSSYTKTITAVFDGGGVVLAAGAKAYIAEVPFNATITGWRIVSPIAGDCVIDIWKDTYVNYPPTVLDTIAGTEKPTLAGVNKNEDKALSTWSTTVTSGDTLVFNVDSASTVTYVVVQLFMRVT